MAIENHDSFLQTCTRSHFLTCESDWIKSGMKPTHWNRELPDLAGASVSICAELKSGVDSTH
jgi:hypothetical protein